MALGTQFNKTELQRLMQEQSVDAAPEEEKKSETAPGKKITRILFIAVACVYFALLIAGRFFLPEEGTFMQSLDVFSDAEKPNTLIRIVSYCILILSASAVLRFFINRMAKNSALTKKTGRAVIELLSNCVKYVAVVILLFMILGALGVDTAELLAGVGILGLIVGLGLTSLIEDVVAGVFIIAERQFDVGDIVVADDFRGTVVSIGIRSTQIEDDGGDIMIMRNSEIGNLINMTNRASYAICDIPINPTESFAHVEEVIHEAHLEKLRERYPEIEKGPFYLGLSEINGKGVQIVTFVAICQENTKYWIQRILNRELKLLFEQNDIKLGEEPGDDDDDD